MKILIIYAHPKTPGHCPLILEEAKKILKDHDVSIIDLYKIKYDPILHENEHYTAGFRDIAKENKKIQQQMLDSDLMIFIYPTWWFSMPAILKGFFDRILTSRFAFRYEGKLPIGLLKEKKAIVITTTGGPTAFYTIFGNTPKKSIKSILKFCGIKTTVYQLGGCTKFLPERVPIVQKFVRSSLKKI